MSKQRPDFALVEQTATGFFRTPVELEEVKQGASTFVYRLRTGAKVFYLRILPEADMTFAGEVKAHEILLGRGVRVPRIIHYEPRNQVLGLSLMVEEEIKGTSAQDSWPAAGLNEILQEAGRELALVNQVPVDGFGWVKRENCGTLLGEKPTLGDLYYEHLESDLNLLPEYPFSPEEAVAIRLHLETGLASLDRAKASLVHGDFDLTHIFHSDNSYSGIIDFGEIMGHHPLYDLSHFKLQDGFAGSPKGFDALLQGYESVTPLTPDDLWQVELWVLFRGVRYLGRLYRKQLNRYHEHFIAAVREQLSILSHGDVG